MQAFQKEVIERLTRIEANQIRDTKILNGNGKPGLVEKFDKLEDRVLALETARDTEVKSHHKFIAIIGWLITTAVACYAALKS